MYVENDQVNKILIGVHTGQKVGTLLSKTLNNYV